MYEHEDERDPPSTWIYHLMAPFAVPEILLCSESASPGIILQEGVVNAGGPLRLDTLTRRQDLRISHRVSLSSATSNTVTLAQNELRCLCCKDIHDRAYSDSISQLFSRHGSWKSACDALEGCVHETAS